MLPVLLDLKRIKLKHHHHLITNLISGPELSTDPNDWTVTLGEHHLKNEDWFEQSRKVKSIYTHPQYTGGGNEVTDQEIKGIPPDYDVGMRNSVVMSSSRYLCFLCYPINCNLSSQSQEITVQRWHDFVTFLKPFITNRRPFFLSRILIPLALTFHWRRKSYYISSH